MLDRLRMLARRADDELGEWLDGLALGDYVDLTPARLHDSIGPTAVPVTLPEGVKDVGELAPRSDGQALFASALFESVGATPPDAS